jgi:hypothetical protein
MTDLDPKYLNVAARRWGAKIAGLADSLEAAALEWRNPDSPDGFGLPHAAAVMDAAGTLRAVVAEVEKSFGGEK